MNGPVLLALIAAAAAIFAAYMTYRASSKASTVEHRKVDQTAYDRAIGYYEKQLDRVTAQADRLSDQVDKVNAQLASEQDVSNALRNELRALRGQVESLNVIVGELRTRPPRNGAPEHEH